MMRQCFTEPERIIARHLIDAARRASLHGQGCVYCQAPLTRKAGSNGLKRFCNQDCRRREWAKGEKGRASLSAYRKRLRAAKVAA